MHLPILEWGRYIDWHLSGARTPPFKGSAAIVSTDVMTHLQSAYRPDHPYGRGWLRVSRPWARAEGKDGAEGNGNDGNDAEGNTLTHNGSNTYWFAVTWLAVERDFAVLVSCNQGGDVAETACDEASALGIRFLLKE